jgi:thioredoxin-related protein
MIRRRRFSPLFLLILILIFPLSCIDAKTSTSFPEYEKALQDGKKDGKPIMLYFSSQSCPYCALMEQGTLADKEITKILTGFHVVKIPVEGNRVLAIRYRVNVFPTFWFLEGSGKRIVETPGYMDKPVFKRLLEYVKGNHYKTQDLYDFMKKTG